MIASKGIELFAGSPSPSRESALSLLGAVADPVRWTVLRRLSAGQACVCDLQVEVPVALNLLSYHLKVLREAGLVTTSRRGRWVDYRLADGAFVRLTEALPVPDRERK
ncbi:MAG TPA: metalloregulator ArsR/SmtB family transcription factor [Jiangellaceae bacterium]